MVIQIGQRVIHHIGLEPMKAMIDVLAAIYFLFPWTVYGAAHLSFAAQKDLAVGITLSAILPLGVATFLLVVPLRRMTGGTFFWDFRLTGWEWPV
ncbi:hypothetical protein [Cohnella caldifontis]|uniref:hypothetical protein n=1 Tax=Cohnella caldifontis TaxID=3027471 RepID=UPI0023EB4E15|nr:hypothetical protein [Cohnella sp. YIM B05605]